MRSFFLLFILLASLARVALSQSTGTSPQDRDEVGQKAFDTIGRVRASNYDRTVSLQELPILKEAFSQVNDPELKENIASVLVTIGQKDDLYWSVLGKPAEEIVDMRVPYPVVFDENGKSIRGKISPEFQDWVQRS